MNMMSIVTINHSATLLLRTMILQILKVEVITVDISCFLVYICIFSELLFSSYTDGSIKHRFQIFYSPGQNDWFMNRKYPRRVSRNSFWIWSHGQWFSKGLSLSLCVSLCLVFSISFFLDSHLRLVLSSGITSPEHSLFLSLWVSPSLARLL